VLSDDEIGGRVASHPGSGPRHPRAAALQSPGGSPTSMPRCPAARRCSIWCPIMHPRPRPPAALRRRCWRACSISCQPAMPPLSSASAPWPSAALSAGLWPSSGRGSGPEGPGSGGQRGSAASLFRTDSRPCEPEGLCESSKQIQDQACGCNV
jgi:hypothetical protein